MYINNSMTNIQPTLVKKPWGHELWIADGVRTPFATKKILFLAGNQTSLQVHKYKFETSYVSEGYGTLLISDVFFNVDLYVKGNMTQEEIDEHIKHMKPVLLSPGIIFDVSPGHLHRVIATTDLTFMETSTPELDDVVRLQDDTNRANGRINEEHR
jgi:mannose-6-phosphate isomerase